MLKMQWQMVVSVLNFHHCARCMKISWAILASVKRSTKFDLRNEF